MPPPEKLYVYEIHGRLHPPPGLAGADFLGCWREGDYTYLFFSAPKEAEVQGWLAAHPGQGRYSSETVLNYTDWEAGQHLMPIRVAGFYLCPVWDTPAPEPGDLLIRLEPGLAFGSGWHPTTRLCLRLLRRVCQEARPTQVLDLGTGTGVLALAALALGARQVVAVEYNDLAVRAAQRNIRHNAREREILLIQGDARQFAYPAADLALANIHLEVLLDLLQLPDFLDKRRYIFSGLLGTQVEQFRSALAASPLKPVQILDENLWFAVLAEGP
ncbi:MAG: 50S ribosomal protein L11 methyltransferase [Deltaproteobacteria bacterium]|nr:50S ribosomal protein L11 methyltransferase [Deltaproteobacteria bacterium]